MHKSPRGRRTDGDATRSKILAAAGEEFALNGFAETTSKVIAARAEVDLASINYHFGSRSGLYQAVLIEAHGWLVNLGDLKRIALTEIPAASKLALLIDHLVRRAMEESATWQLRVWVREILAPSSHIEVLIQSELRPKLAVIEQIVSELTGIAVGDPALKLCLLSIAAPCMMLLIGRRRIPGPVQDILALPTVAISEHLCAFALAGLKAVAEQAK